MKKGRIAIVLLCIVIVFCFVSGCSFPGLQELSSQYNMGFVRFSPSDTDPEEFHKYKYYCAAGHITLTYCQIHYIPLAMKGAPVLQLGHPEEFFGSQSMDISTPTLTTLYIPGTVQRIARKGLEVYVEDHAENFTAFYCGAVIDLSNLVRYDTNVKCYVPSEKI